MAAGHLYVSFARLINAQGRIAFPPGSASYRRQRRRLLEEDIIVRNGRIDLKLYRWQPAGDELPDEYLYPDIDIYEDNNETA